MLRLCGQDIPDRTHTQPPPSFLTFRRLARSALFPASAMITLGSPRRCSSFTHDLAPLKLSGLVMSYTTIAAAAPLSVVASVV